MLKTKLKKYLKEQSLNYTYERQVLIKILSNNFVGKKFTVKDIQEALKEHYGYINNSTIYRSLKLFLAAEVLEIVSDFDKSHFEDSKTKYYQINSDDDYNPNINYSFIVENEAINEELNNPILNKIIKKVCLEHNLPYKNIQVSIAASNNN